MTFLTLLLLAALNAATPASEVSQALSDGMAAEARGDGPALMAAAMKLETLGAHPAEGENDLAAAWKTRASALGAKAPDAPPWRGRFLGPAYRHGTLAANASFATRQSFIAGQKADISVESEMDALELKVWDDDGKPVCQVTTSARLLGCRWIPPFSGPSTITIANRRAEPARYILVLN